MDWLNDYHDDTILPSIETDPDSLGLVEAWREQVSRLKFEDSTSQATTDLARRRRSSSAATGITTKVKSTSDPLMQTFSRRPSRAIRKITQRANDVNIRYTPNRSDKHASNGRRGGFQAKMFITDSQIFRPSLPLAVEPGLVDISEEEGGEGDGAMINTGQPDLAGMRTQEQKRFLRSRVGRQMGSSALVLVRG